MEYFTCESQNTYIIVYLGLNSIPSKDEDKISAFFIALVPALKANVVCWK